MLIIYIYDLIASDKFLDAIQTIELLDDKYKREGEILKAFIYGNRSEFDAANEILDTHREELMIKPDNLLMLANIVVSLILNYRIKNFAQIEREEYLGKETLLELIKIKIDEKSLIERRNIWIGYYYEILGEIKRSKGNIGLAKKYFEDGLNYRKKIVNKVYEGTTLNSIGSILLLKGEYIQAQSYFNKAFEISRQLDTDVLLPKIYLNIGISSYYTGNIDTSIKNLKNGLNLISEFYNLERFSLSYVYLVLNYLELDDYTNASKYKSMVEQLNNSNNNPIVDLHLKLVKGLYFKNKRRFIHRADAQLLLSSIIDDNILDSSLTRIAMLNLVDLLLDEYKIFGNQDSFVELRQIISTLYQLAQQYESIQLMIQVLIFQARFSLLSGKNKLSEKLINRARNLAYVHSNDKLLNYIESIKSEFSQLVLQDMDVRRDHLIDYLSEIGNLMKEIE